VELNRIRRTGQSAQLWAIRGKRRSSACIIRRHGMHR
jgi:hypothetical protein